MPGNHSLLSGRGGVDSARSNVSVVEESLESAQQNLDGVEQSHTAIADELDSLKQMLMRRASSRQWPSSRVGSTARSIGGANSTRGGSGTHRGGFADGSALVSLSAKSNQGRTGLGPSGPWVTASRPGWRPGADAPGPERSFRMSRQELLLTHERPGTISKTALAQPLSGTVGGGGSYGGGGGGGGGCSGSGGGGGGGGGGGSGRYTGRVTTREDVLSSSFNRRDHGLHTRAALCRDDNAKVGISTNFAAYDERANVLGAQKSFEGEEVGGNRFHAHMSDIAHFAERCVRHHQKPFSINTAG